MNCKTKLHLYNSHLHLHIWGYGPFPEADKLMMLGLDETVYTGSFKTSLYKYLINQ